MVEREGGFGRSEGLNVGQMRMAFRCDRCRVWFGDRG
jgi:hypothetical protein